MSHAQHIVREARRRAGISQALLADRLGTTQSVVARWETGARSPSLASVREAVRACGLELHMALARRDDDHDRLIADYRRMSPAARLDDLLDRLAVEEELRGRALA